MLISLSSILRFASLAMAALVPQVRRWGMLVMLCLVLWGCGWINSAPPRSIVVEAVAQKVNQTQAVLQQQLGQSPETATDWPQASGIHITEHRWLTLQNQPVVEVNGTYHLKGGGLGWGQQRQTRPFSLYLRRTGEDQWTTVDLAGAGLLPEK